MPAFTRCAATAIALVAAATLLGLDSAGSRGTRGGRAPRTAVVSITATDFAFDAPDRLRRGAVTIDFHNDGIIAHSFRLARMEGGRTLRDLERELVSRGTLPAWASDAGGTAAVAPGGRSRVALTLAPGRYVLLCRERLADSSTALMRGMYRAMEVTR